MLNEIIKSEMRLGKLAILIVFVLGSIYLETRNFLLFHTVIELICVFIAFGMVVVALNTHRFSTEQFGVFLGMTYGFTGFFLFLHAITFPGLELLPDTSLNISVQLWIAARYLEGISMVIACILMQREKRYKIGMIKYLYPISTIILLLSIFYWRSFPLCHTEESGFTRFKDVSEYVASVLVMISFYLLIRRKEHIEVKRYSYMLLFLIVSFASGIPFTMMNGVNNNIFTIGHILKVISFYMIYKSLVETSLHAPYEDLSRSNKSLFDKTKELTDMNRVLNAEIDRRNQAELSLEEEREIIQGILGSTTEGVIVKGKMKQTIYVNSGFNKMFEISEAHIEEKDGICLRRLAIDLFHNPDAFIKDLDTAYMSIDCISDKAYLKDGRVLEYNTHTLQQRDIITGRVWNFKDITEKCRTQDLQRQIEEETQLLRQAEEYDAMKTEFFSNISHELKTPLNIILGCIQLLDRNYNDNTCDYSNKLSSLIKHIGIMRQNCYRLLRLINNLIDITRVDSGFMKMKPSNYNIVNLVEEIVQSVSGYIQSKGMDIVFDTETEERFIMCDVDKIERIMLNLLSNAIKFSEPKGIIYVNMLDREDRVVISVKDTGSGIPKEMSEIIFERFRQVDPLYNRRAEGSGIGLSLVKAFVEMHDGNISVKSELGLGSEFIIELPIKLIKKDDSVCNEVAVASQTNVERIKMEFSDIYS